MGNGAHNGPDFKNILLDQTDDGVDDSTVNEVAVDVCEDKSKHRKVPNGLKIRMPEDLCVYIQHVALSKGTSVNKMLVNLLKEHFKGYDGFKPPDYGY